MPAIESSRPSFVQIAAEKALWLLMFTVIAVNYRVLLFPETFYFRDLYMHFIPQKQHLVEFVRSGIIPLWDPYLHGGQPFLADINNVVLYPSNILYFFLPLLAAFNIDIVLHLVLAAAAAYVLARTLNLRPIPAFVSGIIFSSCGFTLSLVNLMNWLLAMPYIPLIILLWHLFLLEKRSMWFVLAVVAASLQFLAGAPELTLISFFTALGWSLVYPYHQPRLRRLIFWMAFAVFSAGITAIQSLPTIEMIRQSVRAATNNYFVFSGWSLHPKRMPEFVIPNFLGSTSQLSPRYFWGQNVEDLHFPYILNIYFGLVPLFLALAALFHKNASNPHGNLRWFLFFFAAAAITFSSGSHLPFFPFIYEHAGILAVFRYPTKLIAASVLPIALLAAYGVNFYYCGSSPISRKLPVLLGCCTILLAICTAILFSGSSFVNSVQTFLFAKSDMYVTEGLQRSFVHATAFSAVASFLALYRNFKESSLQRVLIAAAIAADLVIAGQGINPLAPRSLFDRPPIASFIQDQRDSGKLYRAPTPGRIVYRLPGNEIYDWYRWNIETLNSYTGAFYDIPIIFHEDYDRLAKREIVELSRKVNTGLWTDKLPMLAASGVTLIITPERIKLAQFTKIATITNHSNVNFIVYQNSTAVAPVFFVSKSLKVNSPEAASAAMSNARFDPKNELVVEGSIQTDGNCGTVNATVERTRPGNSVSRVSCSCDGYIVFTDPFYPGWKATIDGKPAKLLKANYAFSAIEVKKGTHRIEKSYRPGSFTAGVIVSFLSVVLLFIFMRFVK